MAEVWVEGKEMDQAARRRNWRARDEFGRLWESTIDIIAQGTCAPINPRGWVDRLDTPQKYLTRSLTKDPDTDQLGIRIKDALAEWAADLEKAHDDYDQRLYNDAMMLFGAEGPKAYEERSPALINFTGFPPQAIEPVWAALDGNKYALGLSDEDPKGIAKYLVKRENRRPSFAEDDEKLLDLEEQHDKEAIGGKRVPVGKGKKEAA